FVSAHLPRHRTATNQTPSPAGSWCLPLSSRPRTLVPSARSCASSAAKSSRLATLVLIVLSWPFRRYDVSFELPCLSNQLTLVIQLTGLCPFMKETSEEWLRPLHIHRTKD